MGVVSAAAGIGILALGFITAGDAVPGDWNYTFKLANERLEYTLSRGDGRVDVQFRQAENRVYELQRLTRRGDVSVSTLESLEREARALAELAKVQPLDDVQKARAKSLAEQGTAVFTEARKQPEIDPARVDAAAAAFNDAVATALGTPLDEPPASPTPEPAETGTPAPDATAVTETPSPSPDPSATATPEPSPTAEATETATTLPQESATAEGSSTAAP
jgi:hypothetical protein